VKDGPWTVDLRLDVPMAAHAAIEPRCAVARFGADQLDIWCATQDPFFIRDVMARDHGLVLEKIVVHNQRMGGAFGGRTIANVEREAAFIARTMHAPIKLQWSREDEFLGGFNRPPSSHRVKVRVGADGLISDWWHALSSSHIIFTSAAMPAWMQGFTNFVGDPGTARGHLAPYAFTRQRRSLQLTRLPLATGPWRGLGAGPNVLAIEAAMDAAARASGQDPVAFRLKHLGQQPRLAGVLQRAAAQAATMPLAAAAPGERIARGVACGIYKEQSVAAAVAEVSVTADRIRVTRLWCSHDCGAMVDARSVRAQVEGNLVWCLGLVLSDELSAPEATPEQTSFAQYTLPRITDMPELHIDLVPSTEAPTGAGETAMVAGAGAIYNALVAATGRQWQRLPARAGT
jgi:isoquinoline 1-oxidoreductase beta subunit